MIESPPTEADLDVLREQLGRVPRSVHSVVRRDRRGHPAVITTYPLIKIRERLEPFPTLYWLTKPELRTAVSHLESLGWIGRIERFLEEDEGLRGLYEEDHKRYAAERWALLEPVDRKLAIDRGFEEALREKGIGGISNPCKVKCLHLQWAHHLARGSAVGEWMAERFDLPDLAR